MEYDIICENCGNEFSAEAWKEGECPSCGAEFFWDSQNIFDEEGNIEDEWTFAVWRE